MKRWTMMVGALAVGAVVPLLALAQGDTKAGKAVYDKSCVACHGAKGEGQAAIAKAMNVQLKHLGSKEVQGKTDPELKKQTLEGTGKMKGVTGLSDADVANLIAFVRTLKQ